MSNEPTKSKLTEKDLATKPLVKEEKKEEKKIFTPKFGVKILASEDLSEIKIIPDFVDKVDGIEEEVEIKCPYDVMKYLLKDASNRIDSSEMTDDIRNAVGGVLTQGMIPIKDAEGNVQQVPLLNYIANIMAANVAQIVSGQKDERLIKTLPDLKL